MAEWLRRGLQILPSQFDSGRGLQNSGCFVSKKKYLDDIRYSSVAQLVEQLTVNQLVAGSSPARGAKNYTALVITVLAASIFLLNFIFCSFVSSEYNFTKKL